MSERVVVAMSGGVDSSVAAALLVEEGFEVIGITMSLVSSASRCCSLEDANDARRVAGRLGIRFYVANYKEAFAKEVIEPFAESYIRGETPIPCVACNSRFKFTHLSERAKALGATKLATGHYARIRRDADTGRFELLRACYEAKDQSYYLFELNQAQLAQTLFPLGEMTKAEVRERARALGLVTADKPESQEICFVPDGNYASVVESLAPQMRGVEGDIVDRHGRVLGRHCGIHHFTIGQRKGLGIASDGRLYVIAIDAQTCRVVVGSEEELETSAAIVRDVRWVSGVAPETALRACVQIRSRHAGVEASLTAVEGGRFRIDFDQPVRAVTPGQAAVFYAGECVLGGGWLEGPCHEAC